MKLPRMASRRGSRPCDFHIARRNKQGVRAQALHTECASRLAEGCRSTPRDTMAPDSRLAQHSRIVPAIASSFALWAVWMAGLCRIGAVPARLWAAARRGFVSLLGLPTNLAGLRRSHPCRAPTDPDPSAGCWPVTSTGRRCS